VLADAYAPPGDTYVSVYAGKRESNSDQPYRIELRAMPDDGSWEREPNGSPARATPLPIGTPVLHGMIHPRGDEADYRIPLLPAGTRAIAISARPIERVDLVIQLLDEQRLVLASASGGGPDAERILRAQIDPSKSYLVLVKDK